MKRIRNRKDDAENVLPHSIQAEQAVLGTILVRPDLMEVLPSTLTADAFYRDAHQRIYRAMAALRERGVAIDFLTVKDHLHRQGDLDEVGGASYLAALSDGIPRTSNANYYADIVTEHALRRGIIRLANGLLSDAYQGDGTGRDVLADAGREIIRLSSETTTSRTSSASELVQQMMADIDRWQTEKKVTFGLPIGFRDLDEALAGLHRGNLVLIAARPGVGKTSLALNIAQHVGSLPSGEVVLVLSMEMSKDELMLRMVSGEARIDSHKIRRGQLADRDYRTLGEALAKIGRARIEIDDTPAQFVEDVGVLARKAKLQHGRLDLIVVDYLQLHRTRQRSENRVQEVSRVSAALKATAKELDVPVLALSQLNRAPEARGRGHRPQLTDLRESGSLEQDADVVLFIHRDMMTDDPDQEGIAEIIIGKQRNGPVGSHKMVFIREYTRFEDLAHA